MKTTQKIYIAIAVLLCGFLFGFLFFEDASAQSFSGVIIGEQLDDSGTITVTGLDIPTATTTGNWAGLSPAYLLMQVDNNNKTLTWSSLYVAYYSDTACSLTVSGALQGYTQPTIDLAQTGFHNVYLDLTGIPNATTTTRCIKVFNTQPF